MDRCLTCGGEILWPNVTYGYGGQICYCLATPRVQRPASLEQNTVDQLKLELEQAKASLINATAQWLDAKDEIDKLKLMLEKCQEQRNYLLQTIYRRGIGPRTLEEDIEILNDELEEARQALAKESE